MAQDPYATLGLSPSATDAELRSAYRRLVQLHHPDHNNGSPEAARRFEAVQEAYARVREMRAGAGTVPPRTPPRSAPRTPPPRATPRPASDPGLDARLADLERELREAQQARQRAEQAARDAAREAAHEAAAGPQAQRRPGSASDEELGYINTDDSFAKILSDVRKEVSERFSDVRGSPEAKRAADLIDEIGAVLRGERGEGGARSDK